MKDYFKFYNIIIIIIIIIRLWTVNAEQYASKSYNPSLIAV